MLCCLFLFFALVSFFTSAANHACPSVILLCRGQLAVSSVGLIHSQQ